MGMFSIDENPSFLEQEFKLKQIKDIINTDISDNQKISYIKLALIGKYKGDDK